MNKNKSGDPTGLGNPNDDSHGQCYAPIEHGQVNRSKKKHFANGKHYPSGWVKVPCDVRCNLKK